MTKKNKTAEFRGEPITELVKAPVEPAEIADTDLSSEAKNPPLPIFKEIFKTVAKTMPSITSDDVIEGTVEEKPVEGQQSWSDLVEEEEQSVSSSESEESKGKGVASSASAGDDAPSPPVLGGRLIRQEDVASMLKTIKSIKEESSAMSAIDDVRRLASLFEIHLGTLDTLINKYDDLVAVTAAHEDQLKLTRRETGILTVQNRELLTKLDEHHDAINQRLDRIGLAPAPKIELQKLPAEKPKKEEKVQKGSSSKFKAKKPTKST